MLYYIRHDGRMRHLELQFRLSEYYSKEIHIQAIKLQKKIFFVIFGL